jgi:hypothetical protein
MAADATDKRLVRGMIWIAVIAVVAYFLPGYGYKAQSAQEDAARAEAERLKPTYDKYYYPPMTDAHLGKAVSMTPGAQPDSSEFVEVRQAEFSRDNQAIEEMLEEEKERCKMPFGSGDATWVALPEDEREPGIYFARQYENRKREIELLCRNADVILEDIELGFRKKYEGNISALKRREKAEEFLRELYITESIIRLCVAAKKGQQAEEVKLGVKTEAYMHIISVTPGDSKATGPFIQKRNPQYVEGATNNRLAQRGKRFIYQALPKFIQEYPVEIVLHCDANTYRRFLRSVRQPGKFLVIRNLEIISPFLRASESDKTELSIIENEIKKNEDPGAAKRKKVELQENHIGVRMSAAGMDFFDPNVMPNGFYAPANQNKAAGGKKGRQRRSPSQ